MDSNSRSTRFNTPPCVPSNATTTVNNNNQFLDWAGANREALMMRNAALQRQWEKERIREEIMAEEILRRRDLEMEVRRELAMEREFARGRAAEALSTFPVVGNGFDGRMPALPAHTRVGSSGTLPFQRPVVTTPTPAPSLPDLGNGNAGKVVFLAKPTTSSSDSGTNAKVYTVGDKKFIVTGAKKKLKKWGCALCKVSASSKQALNEHLQEKKHLENVAKLKANKSAKKQSRSASWSGKKTYGTTTDKKNSGAPKSQNQWYCSLCQVSATSEQNLKDHFRGKGHKAKEAELMANKTTYSPTKNYSIRQKKTDKQEVKPVAKDYKNLSNFRCQDCNISCSSEINLASHLKGKKHIARLEALKQNFTTGTSDTAEKGETHEVAKTEAIENVGGEVHTLKKVEEETMKALDPIEYESVKNEKNTKFPSLELRGKLNELRKEGLKKKFVFLCEDCQLGMDCEPAIASHLNGKKHMARLHAQKKTGGTSGPAEKTKGSEVTKQEAMESVVSKASNTTDESVIHQA